MRASPSRIHLLDGAVISLFCASLPGASLRCGIMPAPLPLADDPAFSLLLAPLDAGGSSVVPELVPVPVPPPVLPTPVQLREVARSEVLPLCGSPRTPELRAGVPLSGCTAEPPLALLPALPDPPLDSVRMFCEASEAGACAGSEDDVPWAYPMLAAPSRGTRMAIDIFFMLAPESD